MKYSLCSILTLLVIGFYGCSAAVSKPSSFPRVFVELAVGDGETGSPLKHFANSVDLDALKNFWSWDCSVKASSVIYSVSIRYWQDIEEYNYSILQWDESTRQYLSTSYGSFSKFLNRPSSGVGSVRVQNPYYEAGLVHYNNISPWPLPYRFELLDCAIKPKD